MPKAARSRTDNVLTMPSVESLPAVASLPETTAGDIARRAYELYCERGREDGHDVEDWLNAERDLRVPRSVTAA